MCMCMHFSLAFIAIRFSFKIRITIICFRIVLTFAGASFQFIFIIRKTWVDKLECFQIKYEIFNTAYINGCMATELGVFNKNLSTFRLFFSNCFHDFLVLSTSLFFYWLCCYLLISFTLLICVSIAFLFLKVYVCQLTFRNNIYVMLHFMLKKLSVKHLYSWKFCNP